MNFNDWKKLAETVSSGTAAHEVLRKRGNDVLIARVPLPDNSTAIFKFWNRRGVRGALRRLTRTSTAHRERRSLQRLRRHGQPVPAPLAYLRLSLTSAHHTECLVIEDLGECRDATEHLKRLIRDNNTTAIEAFNRDLLSSTRALIDCRMLDPDHRLPNFVVTPTERIVRLDFELARSVLLPRLHTNLFGHMLGTLLGSYVFAVQPDTQRMSRFAEDLRTALRPNARSLRIAGEQVRTMLARQKNEGGPDTPFTPCWSNHQETVSDASIASVPLVIMGVPFHNLTFASTVNQIDQLIEIGRPSLVATANVDFIRQATIDPEMRRILYEADIVLADGQPIVRLSRFFGPALQQRVTGSDLTPLLAEYAARTGRSLFLLGGAPGVAEKAGRELQRRYPGLVIAGCYSPEKADVVEMRSDTILDQLHQTKPDILLVAFGAPKQEKWIHMHQPYWRVPVAIGIGGTLDFIAGTQRRASRRLQALGMEWVGRLLADPRRLTRRYLQDGLFLLHRIITLSITHIMPGKRIGPDFANTPERKLLSSQQAVAMCLPAITDSHQVIAERNDMLSEQTDRHLVLHTQITRCLNSLELGLLVSLASVLRRQDRLLVFYCSHSRPMRQIRNLQMDACFELAHSPGDIIQRIRQHNESRRDGDIFDDSNGHLTVILPVELTVGNRPDFEKSVQDAWTAIQASEIIIDASAMRFIDSAGLALLVAWKKKALNDHIAIFFIGFQETVGVIIRQSRLDKYLL